jgi:molybdopterin/thiamine biosynthesis adenylyltransferase
MVDDERYARHLALLGAAGQEKIAAARVMIVGLGGLGAHVAQQLAYLGVGDFLLIDGDRISTSNLNRLIGAGPGAIGEPKVESAARLIGQIQPTASVVAVDRYFESDLGELASKPTALFGCVDHDPARLKLVRAASTHHIPYIDLASDVAPDGEFGGRIVFAKDGERCLSCLGELDQHALARAQMNPEQLAADDRIYGIDRATLATAGPSVVSINGAVASLAVTEFLAWITGLREPRGFLNYRGDRATLGSRADPSREFCHYCMDLWGHRSPSD